MPQEKTDDMATTLVEALFKGVDSVARRIASLIPLGRGIRNAIGSSGEELIAWDHVKEIAYATLVLQTDTPEPASHHIVDQYQNILRMSKEHVADYTGLAAEGLPAEIEIFSQHDWIDANIVSFRFLFDPISDRYVKTIEEMESAQLKPRGTSARRVARSILTIQVGIIMGYISRNVLGQFDLSLPEPEKAGRLYVVETNVNRIDRELGLEPMDFRQWITLHEVTHAFEFRSNDWLRQYLADSMKEYLETIDWKGMSRPDFFRRLRENDIGEKDALRAGGFISIIATPEQRKVLSRLQAIMSVLEGYSNHVMDSVGKEMLRSYETMKERFERRRESKSGAERLFRRLIGIDLKLQQYKLGQQFVDAVVEQEGLEFLNRVWQGPEFMPGLDEVHSPEDWITRIKQLSESERVRK